MDSNFFEKLNKLNIRKAGKIDSKQISETSTTKLLDLAEELKELTSAKELKIDKSIFTHSSSLSLGGGRFPCSSLNCRLKKINQLAQYASLYGDQIYIANFLSDHIAHKIKNNEKFKEEFNNDLIILNHIKPLIEQGSIILFSQPKYICPHCLAKEYWGKDADTRLDDLFEELKKKFIEVIEVKAEFFNKRYLFEINGPEKYIDHGLIYQSVAKLPAKIEPKILQRLQSGDKVNLTRSIVKKLKLHEDLVDKTFKNILFILITSQVFRTSYLTDRSLDIDVLNSISKNQNLLERNYIVERHLTTFVPFLNELEINDIIKLRKREAESFTLFRYALNKAIDEYKNGRDDFSEQDAKQLYGDIIEPKLAQLNVKISSAKKDLIKTTTHKVIGLVGAISFGIYAGFVPSDLAAAASALGLTKVIADYLSVIMKIGNLKDNFRSDELYFLWKVQQLSKK